MSDKKQEIEKNEEELNKSIDALIDEMFLEDETGEDIEKSIDIAGDAKTKADEVANKAPKAQKDEARGAGRPKQISDVPQNDMDGRRDSEYDASITENEGKEDEPDETKQSEGTDQTQDKKRMGKKGKAPAMRPFKKSESGETEEISAEEWEAFQAFQKSEAEAAKKAEEEENLTKAEAAKKENEDLIKSAVISATEDLRKSMQNLEAKNAEQAEIIKSMAKQPVQSKSITGVEQLEKSVAPEENAEPESFSKSDIEDAIEDLVMKSELPADAMAEFQMTKRIYNNEHRQKVESYLEKKNKG